MKVVFVTIKVRRTLACLAILSSTFFASFAAASTVENYIQLKPSDPFARIVNSVSQTMIDSNISTGLTKVSAWAWSEKALNQMQVMKDAQRSALDEEFQQRLSPTDVKGPLLTKLSAFNKSDISLIAKDISIGNAFSPENVTDFKIAEKQVSLVVSKLAAGPSDLKTLRTTTVINPHSDEQAKVFMTSVTNIKTGKCATFLVFEGKM